MIPFNQTYFTGEEQHYIQQAIALKVVSGNGMFTHKCQVLLQHKYVLNKVLLTNSCTAALEMSALLANIQSGDEVIMPSYTFVSTANAFILRGAKIVFADSREDHPGIDEEAIEHLITDKTKALIIVHYAGVACDMRKIMQLSEKYNLLVIEDAAHAIDSYYTFGSEKKALGSIGHLGAFSFHGTKNITCGEGGALIINDNNYSDRAVILHEKGTNRNDFTKGLVNKYEWVDVGSSFLPSEITAAFLFAQLDHIDTIQSQRLKIWNHYHKIISVFAKKFGITTPAIPDYAIHNASIFYIVLPSKQVRDGLLIFLQQKGITAAFHYTSLHQSKYFKKHYSGGLLLNADRYSDTLLRLPLFCELNLQHVESICNAIEEYNVNNL
jgi:dTDP-4-amino-4,6-dideoxygalactose transaminase